MRLNLSLILYLQTAQQRYPTLAIGRSGAEGAPPFFPKAQNRPHGRGLFFFFFISGHMLFCHRRASRERGNESSALVISVPNVSIHLSQSALLLTNWQGKGKSVWCVNEWDRFLGFYFSSFFFHPLYALLGRQLRCGLHVLYITDICHAEISNLSSGETFVPSGLA